MDNSATLCYNFPTKTRGKMDEMTRYLTFQELSNEIFFAEKIECHRQSWQDGTEWLDYSRTPRFASGISLICSPVTVKYRLNDGTRLEASEGDLVFLGKSSRYTATFYGGGKDTDLYTVNFILRDKNGDELRLSRDVTIFRNAVTQNHLSIASELADAYLFPHNRIRLQAMLLRLLDSLGSYFERQSENYYPIRHGVLLLCKEWRKNEKIGRYAEECGISERKFYSYFKKWSGKSPVDYRNELRIAAARSRLISTNQTIAQIAFKVGFDDPYYFSRVFKKLTGISPAVYRKNGGEISPAAEEEKSNEKS